MTRKTILIADDDVPMLQALAVRLRSEGYDVILAQDWHQAVERARVNEPDLIMINARLAPDADIEASRRALEEVVDLATTPLIAISNDHSLRAEPIVSGGVQAAVQRLDAVQAKIRRRGIEHPRRDLTIDSGQR